mmetsp:Transcript_27522/g.63109  ORF Transcript_27522/g.63109 Transcript_27522/m.63109 type:complete len:84 (-) Transcript_27522:37-288(-)
MKTFINSLALTVQIVSAKNDAGIYPTYVNTGSIENHVFYVWFVFSCTAIMIACPIIAYILVKLVRLSRKNKNRDQQNTHSGWN